MESDIHHSGLLFASLRSEVHTHQILAAKLCQADAVTW